MPRTIAITDHLLGLLSLVETEGSAARITQQLDRKDYEALNKVLEACGGTWNRSLKRHVFPSDATERLDRVLVTGEYTTDDGLGFFPTPAVLAAWLVKTARVRPGHFVLEPSAGTGAIVEALYKAAAKVVAVEIAADRFLQIRDNGPSIRKLHADFLALALLALLPEGLNFPGFDRIVMNPPFRKAGRGDWIDHVRHAFEMLVSGGILVSVVPRSIEYRQDKRHVEMAAWIEHHGKITRLEDDAFGPSGTSCRTNVIRLVKP
jgi:16S rRNA G966 N2-methylase RsmD